MTRWELLSEFRAAMKDPERIGDAAVYKAELARGSAYPEIEAQLDGVRGYMPRVDLEALARLPDGTFGREYARFLAANRLHPIVPTDRVDRAMIARNAFTVRYAIIHDMVHVITGFDTTWPGEAGVWAFIGAQRYSLGFRIAGVVSLLIAPFRTPLRIGDAWRAWQRGRAMGRRARLVLTQRLEEHFEQRLSDLRVELGVEGADDGYLPRALRAAGATS
jgi:ubiquinone biosynthesis protein COQ4